MAGLTRLAIDLTGAEATLATPVPVANEQIGAGPRLAAFELDAAPLHFEAIPVHLRVRLASAATEFARAAEGALALALASAASGESTCTFFMPIWKPACIRSWRALQKSMAQT
jgi:hypothetical protein